MNVIVDRVSYFVEEYKSAHSATTIVLLHGFGGSGLSFSHLIRAMNPEFSVVTVDLIGHGRTINPLLPELHTLDGQVSHLSILLTKMNVNNPWIYGYSMGGRIALNMVLKKETPISGVILESAQLGIQDTVERQKRVELDIHLSESVRNDPSAFFAKWNRLPLFKSPDNYEKEPYNDFLDIQTQQDKNQLSMSLRYMSPGLVDAITTEQLVSLRAPFSVITGKLDAKYDSFWVNLAQELPQIHHDRVPNAGHRIHLDQPRALASKIVHFIESNTKY
jgi:2-succinyl-6-hydroxy-2,4-cyclohexadiene-1-carboxylate synthase